MTKTIADLLTVTKILQMPNSCKIYRDSSPISIQGIVVELLMVVTDSGAAGFHPKIPLKKFTICPNR